MQKNTFVFMFLIFIYFRKTAHCCVPWNLQNSVPGGHGTVLPSCSRPVELPGAGYWVLTGKEFYKTLSIIGAYQKQSQQNDLTVILIEGRPPNDREDLIDREPALRISPFSVHQLGCNFIPTTLRDSLYKCTCISRILFYCFYTPAPKETGELLVIQVQSRV